MTKANKEKSATTRQEETCLLQPKAANMSWADLKPYCGFCQNTQIVQTAKLKLEEGTKYCFYIQPEKPEVTSLLKWGWEGERKAVSYRGVQE